MENFLNFVIDHYLIFTIISAILILSLIGYTVEKTISKDVRIKPTKENKKSVESVNIISNAETKTEVDTL